MSRKKLSTTVYITPEQGERLKALHARTKVPVAEYIRQGIDLVLQKKKPFFSLSGGGNTFGNAHIIKKANPGLWVDLQTWVHDQIEPRVGKKLRVTGTV